MWTWATIEGLQYRQDVRDCWGWGSFKTHSPIFLQVTDASGHSHECRSYEVVDKIVPSLQPSPGYKGVILCGARELQLPEEYVEKLMAIEDNGYDGEYPPGLDKWLPHAAAAP